MDIRPIKTENDYSVALKEAEQLFNVAPESPEGDRLEVLVTLIEAYEEKHYPISLPDPVEAILYHIESRGLSRRDLVPFIGSRARVSEVLNRKRPLTIGMIPEASHGLRHTGGSTYTAVLTGGVCCIAENKCLLLFLWVDGSLCGCNGKAACVGGRLER